MRKLVSLFLCWNLAAPAHCFAESRGGNSGQSNQPSEMGNEGGETATGEFMLRDELSGIGRGSEYVSGYYKGAVLMEVNLWGAVAKPGVHHVPMKINIVNFLSLAGGPSKDAIIEDVLITRKSRLKGQVIKVSLQDLLEDPNADRPILEANDTIVVKQKTPWISQDTLGFISVAATIIGLSLTAIVVAREMGRK